MLGTSNRTAVAERIDQAYQDQAVYRDALSNASPEEVLANPELLEFALAGGRSAFGDNCAPCHGSGAAGLHGLPQPQ